MGNFYGSINFKIPETRPKTLKEKDFKRINELKKWISNNKKIFSDVLGDICSIDDDTYLLWCLDEVEEVKYEKLLKIITDKLSESPNNKLNDWGYEELSNYISPMFVNRYKKEGNVFKYTSISDKELNYTTFSPNKPPDMTALNEILNFSYLDFLNKNFKNLTDYFISQFQPQYAKIKKVKSTLFFQRLEIEQKLYIILLMEFSDKWSKSAELTSKIIKSSKIFNFNYDYSFFSEKDVEYKTIFNDVLAKMKKSPNKILGDYVNTLMVDKYFISDAIATTYGAFNAIKRYANKLNTNSSLEEFQNLFELMDFHFSNKSFIPVSFKQIEELKSNPNAETIRSIENVGSNKVFIINPPASMRISGEVDSLDLIVYEILADLAEGGSIKKYLGKTIFIDYSSFKYDVKNLTEYTYGGSSYPSDKKIFFIFEVRRGDKSKKYSFSVDKYVKIKAIGSASITGEGTINMQSINFILSKVYSEVYNKELRKLADARIDIFKKKCKEFNLTENNLQNNDAKKLAKKYVSIMGELSLLNPSSKAKYLKLVSNFDVIYANDEESYAKMKLICAESFIQYITSLQESVYGRVKKEIKLVKGRKFIDEIVKIKLKYAKTAKEKSILNTKFNTNTKQIINDSRLSDAFVCELGLLMDKGKDLKISVINDETIKVELSETKKKQLILSAWSLLSGRGAIVFNEKVFRTAKSIKDVMYTKIKLPALVKIGI